MLKKLNFQLI